MKLRHLAGIAALAAGATCIALLALAVAAPAYAYTVKSAQIIGSYTPEDAGYGANRGRDLGFKAEASFEEIIRVHIADELGGKIA